MTQMLLFDPPATANTFSPVITTADPAPAEIEIERQAVPQDDVDLGGMHRMGDLARLVLMRYDLVAQRRAELAAKRKRK